MPSWLRMASRTRRVRDSESGSMLMVTLTPPEGWVEVAMWMREYGEPGCERAVSFPPWGEAVDLSMMCPWRRSSCFAATRTDSVRTPGGRSAWRVPQR